MKKMLKTVLAAALALSVTACGKGGETTSGNSEGLKEWHTWQTLSAEIATWNVLKSQASADLGVISNLVDGLLCQDTKGQLIPCLATEWSSNEDATEWTFTLREGVKWVDYEGNEKGELSPEDFVTGLEYVLNYNKNGGANASMPIDMIKGAAEYYKGTQDGTLSEEDFLNTVGIRTEDNKVIYTMVSPKPYFDTLAVYSPLYPTSAAALEEYGDAFGTDNKTIYYNGAYLCSEYVNKNSKTLIPNPTWWDTESTRFEKVTIAMVDDKNMAWNLFQSGEVDHAELTEDVLSEIYNAGESHEYYKYLVEKKPNTASYVFHFNFNSKLEDGSDDVNWNTAAANKNFRLCWYYGLDWTDFLKRINKINPQKCINDAYTRRELAFTTDGTDYVDLVLDRLGYESDKNTAGSVHARYDAEKFAEVKEAAISELTAQGVTFPIDCYYFYKAGDGVAADTAAIFKQMVEEQFGSDFINIKFRTYTDSSSKEIRDPELFSVTMGGWSADFGDPITFIGNEGMGDNAFWNGMYSNNTPEICAEYGEFVELLNKADKIVEKDERYNAFADAEAFFIENALAIPTYYNILWQITRCNDYSKITGMYGISEFKYINWETTSEIAYTTEEYAEFAK